MASKESQVAAQVRLNQWALEIQDCRNRPRDMTIEEWCEQHNIKRASYYWRLKRVRQACLEQMEVPTANFVELPVPVQATMPSSLNPAITSNTSSAAAVLHTASGIFIEIREGASAGFIKTLIGAVTNA